MNKGTKIFGFTVPVSQNVLAAILIPLVIVALFFAFRGSSSDETAVNTAANLAPAAGGPVRPASTRAVSTARRKEAASNKNKQGVLKIQPVDPSAMVDPTLKLALLDRVRSVKLAESGRNLFDSSEETIAAPSGLPKIPTVKAMMPKPVPEPYGPKLPPPKPPPPPVNIPLRYYGFVRPTSKADGNRGYFMDGDQILMATEGDVLKSRFLVEALSPSMARVKDIQLKQGQDLPLIPEAVVTQ